jgi:hypothetical protein
MLTKTATTLFSIFIIFSTTIFAQKATFEKGEIDELKGVERIYIDTATDTLSYNKIATYIRRELPDLIITTNPEEAQARLAFTTVTDTYISHSYTSGTIYANRGTCAEHTIIVTNNAPTYLNYKYGVGLVTKCQGADRLRVLMEFKDYRSTVFEHYPSINFAKAFVDAFKKVNKK